jgi:hypothetical protein
LLHLWKVLSNDMTVTREEETKIMTKNSWFIELLWKLIVVYVAVVCLMLLILMEWTSCSVEGTFRSYFSWYPRSGCMLKESQNSWETGCSHTFLIVYVKWQNMVKKKEEEEEENLSCFIIIISTWHYFCF